MMTSKKNNKDNGDEKLNEIHIKIRCLKEKQQQELGILYKARDDRIKEMSKEKTKIAKDKAKQLSTTKPIVKRKRGRPTNASKEQKRSENRQEFIQTSDLQCKNNEPDLESLMGGMTIQPSQSSVQEDEVYIYVKQQYKDDDI